MSARSGKRVVVSLLSLSLEPTAHHRNKQLSSSRRTLQTHANKREPIDQQAAASPAPRVPIPATALDTEPPPPPLTLATKGPCVPANRIQLLLLAPAHKNALFLLPPCHGPPGGLRATTATSIGLTPGPAAREARAGKGRGTSRARRAPLLVRNTEREGSTQQQRGERARGAARGHAPPGPRSARRARAAVRYNWHASTPGPRWRRVR
jgi:hypothetical protein